MLILEEMTAFRVFEHESVCVHVKGDGVLLYIPSPLKLTSVTISMATLSVITPLSSSFGLQNSRDHIVMYT